MPQSKPTFSEHRKPCDLPTPESTASFWHTQPSPLLVGHRSTRHLPATADVVIIGSGITGAGAAHHLMTSDDAQSANLNVVMLEAREACWGATGRNGGHCQPLLESHPEDPSIGHFELKNFHTLHDLIKAKDIDCEFVVQPSVHAAYSQHVADRIKRGLSIVKENAPELASMMRIVTDKEELNALRIPTADIALVTSIAARLWPYKLVAHILEDLLTSTSLKGSFNLQTLTPVTKIHQEDGAVVVQTERGSIKAKKVILATNGYTSHLLPNFADLIVPCRGHMSALIPTPSVKGDDRIKTSLGFAAEGVDDYLIQRPNHTGAYLMFGGGRGRGPSLGLTDDSVVDDNVAKYLRSRLITALGLPEGSKSSSQITGAFVPSVHRKSTTSSGRIENINELEATHMWSGVMGYSRDERPWVGLVPDMENVYISAGYTGHGMPNTWLSGKTVAMIVQKTLAGEDESSAMEAASAETGLPESYRTSKERVERAMELESVEAVDWADMELGRLAGRMHPGFA